jgi:transposase-like protein
LTPQLGLLVLRRLPSQAARPLVLWEQSVVEQRYNAVQEVLGGMPVVEVAERYGVSRQSVHSWLRRYRAGGRCCRPDKCHADKAYDNRRCRGYLTRRGIKVRIARCGVESSDRLGRHRWKAERSIAWLAGCRRLRIRYERDSERFFAFAMLACARLCYNRLPQAAEAHARSA